MFNLPDTESVIQGLYFLLFTVYYLHTTRYYLLFNIYILILAY